MSIFEFENTGSTEQGVSLVLNGNSLFANNKQIIAEIKSSPYFEEFGFPFAAWDWLIKNHYDSNPYTAEAWEHAPYLFINSLGLGLCDDAAIVFYELVTSYGYGSVRVWELQGHVVCELFENGKWHLFDPNLRTLYIDDEGDIAGYDYITQHPDADFEGNLLNSKYAGIVQPSETAYSSWVIDDIYGTTGNNSFYYEPKQAPFSQAQPTLRLPPGASLRIAPGGDVSLSTTTGNEIPELMLAEVRFGALSGYSFEYPLIPIAIDGEGQVEIDGVVYEMGSESLQARLDDRSTFIASIKVSTSGEGNTITYLVNPVRYDFDSMIDLAGTQTGGNVRTSISGTWQDDVLTAASGLATVRAEAGDDVLTQIATGANAAAGSVLDGGDGNDEIVFSGVQAYTSSYLTVSGGAGADTISVGAGKNDYVGSVWVDGDAGDDTITIGHIQGSTGGAGHVDGGDGQDRIHVMDSLGGIGIWGNWAFFLRGGAGADSFQVDGAVLNVLGNGEGVQLDGGDGFDVLHWSGKYNLTVGGRQNPALGLYSGYRQELEVANIEQVDLGGADVSGLTLEFSAGDVAAITAGSDFDRASLGLGLDGAGTTLLLDAGRNFVNLAAWARVGGAVLDEQGYAIYRSGASYLGVASLVLAGTDAADVLNGYSGDDSIDGADGDDLIDAGGGANQVLGGAGDDILRHSVSGLNEAAGSALDGGAGNDQIVFSGRQAYTASYMLLQGGDGDDLIRAAVQKGEYVGAVRIEGGAGKDVIETGHIEGSTGGAGYIDGGDGDDLIRVLDTWGGIGIWGNSRFQLLGGTGNDRFELSGTQLSVRGGSDSVQLDGGSGFDTVAWNGKYNLTSDGRQNAALGTMSGHKQQLEVSNIEHLNLASQDVAGLALSFSQEDVAAITAGSDFDRAALGLDLSGQGNTLFIDAGENYVELAGWTRLGKAMVEDAGYAVYQSASSYLGVSSLTLAGTTEDEVLKGYSGDDLIEGDGGADLVSGGAGEDILRQSAATLNGAAGSVLDGGLGNDKILFSGSQAYTSNYMTLKGGEGDDLIQAAAGKGEYVGAVRIEGGAGKDVIETGHIEGSTGGGGMIDGGEGDDLIRVLDTWGGIGIWGNGRFRLLGGAGDDRFELGGTQLTVRGGSDSVQLDGGSGFDTLSWNGKYNLTAGGRQNAALGTHSGYKQELEVANIERLDLASQDVAGLELRFSQKDVLAITSGSDFDRASLGLDLSGEGNTLFVNAGANQVDLGGWTMLGEATVEGADYAIYQAGETWLGLVMDVTLVGQTPDLGIGS